jgi:2-keto-4-pentenoate hydratase/2-oxohepta-3-ene-1,7-dioic acid hydratase in catechol pathway
MKFATIEIDGQPRIALVSEDEKTLKVGPADKPYLEDVIAADGLGDLAKACEASGETVSVADATFLPVVTRPKRIVCIGYNYPKIHPVEGQLPPPKDIGLFMKLPGVLVGHRHDLIKPVESDTYDFECEVTVVIGKKTGKIAAEDAWSVIAGITVMNDGSVRGWQKHSVPAGKNFRQSGSLGPWMTTIDAMPENVSDWRLKTVLNGEVMQDGAASDTFFDIPALLAYITSFTDLEPGDIVSTGSPEGSGGGRSPQRFLKAGDELEFSITGVGTLTNRVVNP